MSLIVCEPVPWILANEVYTVFLGLISIPFSQARSKSTEVSEVSQKES